jgi:Tol biopolymer transport system component
MTGTITKVDIFTIPEAGGTEFRVTSKAKTGSPTNELPTYSPDGQYIAFAACSGYVGDCALYRIRADGVGKAIKIAGGTNQNWRPHYWRR